jgi:phosphopantothenoylcysteine synthetase/decarboxylase
MGSLSGRKIMVTSGGTREYIDDVRVVTNISTGALGAKIAEELYSRGAEVFYVHGKQSCEPFLVVTGIDGTARLSSHEFVTVKDLMETMEALIKGFKIDTVIHSAAVSDFTFKNTKSVKLSSGSKEAFIEFLRKTIRTTPKIIKQIRKWNPEITLVGFKFTVGMNYTSMFETACKALKANKADLIVANDKSDMKHLGMHRAYLINTTDRLTVYSRAIKEIQHDDEPRYIVMDGKAAIASGIADFLDGSL